MPQKIKPMPKLEPIDFGQCINCGRPFHDMNSTARVVLNQDQYVCEKCYRGYLRYLSKLEEHMKAGNPLLAKALEEGTAREYEALLKLGIRKAG